MLADMDAKTLIATLAVLGTGLGTVACDKKGGDASEVKPTAKADSAKKDDAAKPAADAAKPAGTAPEGAAPAKEAEGSCGAGKDAADGADPADAAAKGEGSCGEGSCGAKKPEGAPKEAPAKH